MRKKLSLGCNLLVAGLTLAAWLMMCFQAAGGDATLAAAGLRNLKFFTILSNLLNGLVSLIYAIALGRALRGKGAGIGPGLQTLKLTATAAVALTWLVVMGFLGPIFGYRYMFLGANLWFHLLLPLLSMAEFALLDTEAPLPFRATLFAALPALLYGCGYALNLLRNGVPGNDWYGFVHWGWGIGFLIFGAIVLASWGLAILLRAINTRAKLKETLNKSPHPS